MNRVKMSPGLEVWDDLPAPYEADMSSFDRFSVIVQDGFNGCEEPVVTVFMHGWPVMTIDVDGWELQQRTYEEGRMYVGEETWELCFPQVNDTGSHAQTIASFMRHVGMVGDPEGDDAFVNAVAMIGIWKAQEESPSAELLDDGHEVLAFVERMVEKYRQFNPEM